MDPARVALIRAGRTAAPSAQGSGYVVGPHLVLTALHVVVDEENRFLPDVVVRVGHPRYGDGLVERSGQVCWPDPRQGPPGPGAADVALVWLHEAVEVGGVPVRWGRVGGTEPVPYEGAGFPLFAREVGGPEFEYLRGELLPVATGGGRVRVLDTRAWPTGSRGERPWAGASGSAVFCHGRLVGVAVEDGPRLGWRRLYAEPVDELFTDAEFTDLLERHGGLDRLPTVEEVRAGDANVNWPRQVGVVPQVSGLFQHRAEVIALVRALDGGGQAVLGQGSTSPGSRAQVVAGTGGVGKTQLAAHYATAVRHASGWLTTPVGSAGGGAAGAEGQTCLCGWMQAAARP